MIPQSFSVNNNKFNASLSAGHMDRLRSGFTIKEVGSPSSRFATKLGSRKLRREQAGHLVEDHHEEGKERVSHREEEEEEKSRFPFLEKVSEVGFLRKCERPR